MQSHLPIVRKTVNAKRAVRQNAEKNPVASATIPAIKGSAAIPR
jgi:hypothetical protein